MRGWEAVAEVPGRGVMTQDQDACPACGSTEHVYCVQEDDLGVMNWGKKVHTDGYRQGYRQGREDEAKDLPERDEP
jgi:hypothetical protein